MALRESAEYHGTAPPTREQCEACIVTSLNAYLYVYAYAYAYTSMDESILATCLSLAFNARTAAQRLRQLCDTFGQSRRRIQDAAMRLNACHSTLTLLDWRWKMEARSIAPTHATHPDGDMTNDDLVRLWGEEGKRERTRKASTPINYWQIGCREMRRYIQHLHGLLTTAQSLIDSVMQPSETAQTGKRGPATSRSQHSTGRYVHNLLVCCEKHPEAK